MGRLCRSTNNRVIGGVCAGVADFFGLDAKMVRIAWLVAVLFGGVGVLLYFILFFILPEQKISYEERMNKRMGK